ncbi:MAG: MFS transporter [Nitrososphaerota archaeon]
MMSNFSRNIKLLTAGRVISSIGFSSTIPFLAVYLSVERNVSLIVVGAMYLVQGIAGILSMTLSGFVSDKIGPRRTMLIGYLFSLLSSLILAFLVYFNINPLIIIITYPVFSFLRGFSITPTATLAADEKTDVITNFSLLVMAGNLGFAIGPAIGGFVVSLADYAALFFLNSVFTLASAVLAVLTMEGTYHLAREKEKAKPDIAIATFLLLTFLGFIVIGQDIEPFAIYSSKVIHVSNLIIGYLFSFSGAMIVAMQIPAMTVLRRYGIYACLIIGCTLGALASVVIAAATNELHLLIGMAIITLAEIFLTVPSQVWITLRSPGSRKGAYQGYYSSIRTSGRSAAAWLGSTMMGIFVYPHNSWYVVSMISLLTGIAFLYHERLFAKKANST